MRSLFSKEGRFYKSNLHTHSTLSDGKLTPEELKADYTSRGYAILAYTDHRRMIPHPELQDEEFLPLTATELDFTMPESKGWPFAKTYHLNLYAEDPQMSSDPYSYDDRYDLYSINRVLREAREKGCLISYNHPLWSLQEKEDFIGLEGVWTFEIYNHGCEIDGGAPMTGWACSEYDQACRAGMRVGCIATDDNHNEAGGHDLAADDSFGGFTMIKAPALRYDAVFAALKAGDYYASTGPEITELVLDGQTLHIACSPCRTVALVTDSRFGALKTASTDELTRVSLPFSQACGYIRVVCTDSHGNRAMSRAYFRDELSDEQA